MKAPATQLRRQLFLPPDGAFLCVARYRFISFAYP